MEWTQDKPSEPGWYWFLPPAKWSSREPRPVQVASDGWLWVSDEYYSKPGENDLEGAWYWGPIPQPYFMPGPNAKMVAG